MDQEVTGKRLLILGGTRISCEIVRLAKEMGCFVGVVDYNPISDSPAKQIADESYEISVTDIDAIVELIKREHYEGVIVGFADAILPAYAEICQKAGLPSYATKKQLEVFTHKDLYKPLLRKYGIPTVDEYKVDISDIDRSVSKIAFPLLVKPADSAGARGITICYNADELKDALEKAKSFSHSGIVLVERYIEGREVTINWLFVNGKYYLTCIANRHVKHNQEGVIPLPVGYTYPASITSFFQDNLEEKCKKMFREQGIQNGTMFMQCKVENGIPIIYDIGYRMTGTMEYTNLEDACGYNPNKMLIHFALTGSMGEPNIVKRIDPYFGGRFGFNVSNLAATGTISKLEGIEEVSNFPEVARSVIAHYPGETITEKMRGLLAQITVRTLGTVDDEKELYRSMKKIENTIKIISTEGTLLNLPGIEPEDIEGYIAH